MKWFTEARASASLRTSNVSTEIDLHRSSTSASHYANGSSAGERHSHTMRAPLGAVAGNTATVIALLTWASTAALTHAETTVYDVLTYGASGNCSSNDGDAIVKAYVLPSRN